MLKSADTDSGTAGISAGVKAVGRFLLYFLDSSVLKRRVFCMASVPEWTLLEM